VVGHVADRIQQLENSKKQEIATTEASIAEVETQKTANESALREMSEKENVLKRVSEAADAAVTDATKAVAVAKEVHSKAQQVVGSMATERERHVAQKGRAPKSAGAATKKVP